PSHQVDLQEEIDARNPSILRSHSEADILQHLAGRWQGRQSLLSADTFSQKVLLEIQHLGEDEIQLIETSGQMAEKSIIFGFFAQIEGDYGIDEDGVNRFWTIHHLSEKQLRINNCLFVRMDKMPE
ncbi:MAG: hypothetical protein AAF206_25105, partial [Bacteroidota bacterium]